MLPFYVRVGKYVLVQYCIANENKTHKKVSHFSSYPQRPYLDIFKAPGSPCHELTSSDNLIIQLQ